MLLQRYICQKCDNDFEALVDRGETPECPECASKDLEQQLPRIGMPKVKDAMNSQQRADLLATVAELCEKYPDWRLAQLVANVAGWADQEIWDVEDEQLLEAARLHLQQLASSEKEASCRTNPGGPVEQESLPHAAP